MKGIVLAGGSGTRLYPVTLVMSKQLLPIYDKPMIYYPLTTLMLADIREILIITTPTDVSRFQQLLGDGSKWGLSLSYVVQHAPEGLAQSFLLGRGFLGDDSCAFILGDNIFYGNSLQSMLARAVGRDEGATVFAYPVTEPARYGVVEFDAHGKAIGIEEKPDKPRSHYALTGLYFYDNQVLEFARAVRPSARGELEITDINMMYLNQGRLNVDVLGRGMMWLDAGTHESFLEAATFIETIEKRQGMKIACPEEIAFRKEFISAAELEKLSNEFSNSAYGSYLKGVLRGEW